MAAPMSRYLTRRVVPVLLALLAIAVLSAAPRVAAQPGPEAAPPTEQEAPDYGRGAIGGRGLRGRRQDRPAEEHAGRQGRLPRLRRPGLRRAGPAGPANGWAPASASTSPTSCTTPAPPRHSNRAEVGEYTAGPFRDNLTSEGVFAQVMFEVKLPNREEPIPNRVLLKLDDAGAWRMVDMGVQNRLMTREVFRGWKESGLSAMDYLDVLQREAETTRREGARAGF